MEWRATTCSEGGFGEMAAGSVRAAGAKYNPPRQPGGRTYLGVYVPPATSFHFDIRTPTISSFTASSSPLTIIIIISILLLLLFLFFSRTLLSRLRTTPCFLVFSYFPPSLSPTLTSVFPIILPLILPHYTPPSYSTLCLCRACCGSVSWSCRASPPPLPLRS